MLSTEVRGTILLTTAALFVAGGLLILAGRRWRPSGTTHDPRMLRLYGSEFLIVGAVLIATFSGNIGLTLALVALALRGAWELTGAAAGRPVAAWLTALALAAISPATLMLPMDATWLLLPVALLALLDTRRLPGSRRWTWWLSVQCLAVLLLAISRLGIDSGGAALLWVFTVTESTDAFALVFGKWLGRRRPFPRLSPGKTLEGLLGGWVVGGLVGWLLWPLLIGDAASPLQSPPGAIALVLGAGLAGDLAVSALKRHYAIKDLPSIMATQGGVLDIYDSLLFAAAALWLLTIVQSAL